MKCQSRLNSLLILVSGLYTLVFLTPSSLAADIDGQTIPDSISIEDSNFMLAGCGKREMLWNSLYLVSLYLLKPTTNAEKIMDDSVAKTVRLKVLYDNELPDELPDLWREPLQQEMNREMLDTVLNLYAEISTGDIVLFSYHPEKGTRVTLNDEKMISRDSATLVTTLLNNWIGAEPVSENLKRLLLSGSCQ